jgi:hypothetical protein
MIGVLGSTGACVHCDLSLPMVLTASIILTDTSIRAIGKRAHPMHMMTFYSLLSTIMAPLGFVNIPLRCSVIQIIRF